MNVDHDKEILITMKTYPNSKITQTYTQDNRTVVSVCYEKEKSVFIITKSDDQTKEEYTDLDKAMKAIKELLRYYK